MVVFTFHAMVSVINKEITGIYVSNYLTVSEKDEDYPVLILRNPSLFDRCEYVQFNYYSTSFLQNNFA